MPTLNIKSTQQAIKVGEHKGEEMFVMKVEHYNTMDAERIMDYAAETHDIPPRVVAAGNPCRVIRPITDADKVGFVK